MRTGDCNTITESIVVDGSPDGVAGALRYIADRIQAQELCLIGLWSTGFGEVREAVIQVTYDADGYPSITDDD